MAVGKETERTAIVDGNGQNILLSVVPTTTDPTINGVVICDADGSNIG